MAPLDGDIPGRTDESQSLTPMPAPALPASSVALRTAMRRARVDAAERTDVLAELRGAEVARLEMLQDAIAPVLAAVPPGVDLFDAGLVPGAHPRFFVDMIAFVDMGRDRRVYRFHQDTREGRTLLAESERLETMTDAVTAYVARRLVEREKLLAALPAAVPAEPASDLSPTHAPARKTRWVGATLGFCVDLFGTAALVLLLLAGLWYAGTSLLTWVNRP